jgi:DNA-binding transcriptional MocR family regulator
MFDRHLVALRSEHRRRRDALVRALQRSAPSGALRFSIPEGGLFLWCRVAPDVSARAIQDRALRDGVSIVTGEPFYTDDAGAHEIRLCFSSRPPDVLARAAKVVAAAVADAARTAAAPPALRRLV